MTANITTTTATTKAALQILQSAETMWFRFPQYPRFLASGGIGNIVLFYMDEGLYNSVIKTMSDSLPALLREHEQTVSFFVAYLGQIFIQHYLHAVLVFGRETIQTREKYWKTLKATYATLSGILVGSTICNALLIRFGVSKKIAFWSTLYGFGIVSYLILKLTSTMSNNTVSMASKSPPSLKKVKRGGATAAAAIANNGAAAAILLKAFVEGDKNWGGMSVDNNNHGGEKQCSVGRTLGVSLSQRGSHTKY